MVLFSVGFILTHKEKVQFESKLKLLVLSINTNPLFVVIKLGSFVVNSLLISI